jgi:hypothetical protein
MIRWPFTRAPLFATSSFPAGASTFDADNSQVIVTHGGDKRYRLILTTSTTLHDGTVEASVYLVPAFLRKDYDRQDTTLLLKGLQIVCRFRFLFLESQSDSYWFNIEGWGTARLPTSAAANVCWPFCCP